MWSENCSAGWLSLIFITFLWNSFCINICRNGSTIYGDPLNKPISAHEAGAAPIPHSFLRLCLRGGTSNDCSAPCQQSNFPTLLSSFISNCLPVCTHPPLLHFSPPPECAANIAVCSDVPVCLRAYSQKPELSPRRVIVASDVGGGGGAGLPREGGRAG